MRTPHEGIGLGLGLGSSGLGLGLGLERKVLALARPQAKTSPQDPGHVVAVRVYALHTIRVSHDSLPFLV